MNNVAWGLEEKDMPGTLLAAMEVVAAIYERIEHEGNSVVVVDWSEETNRLIAACRRGEKEPPKKPDNVIRLRDVRPFRAP
jgi:hypothetical protein